MLLSSADSQKAEGLKKKNELRDLLRKWLYF